MGHQDLGDWAYERGDLQVGWGARHTRREAGELEWRGKVQVGPGRGGGGSKVVFHSA